METVPAKTILSGYTEQNPWFGSNYNMNLYKGCHHGCIYCDSRSDCYQIQRFDTVRPKANAIPILRKELSAKRNKGVVGTGAMSDPYNRLERELRLTRQALELISQRGFGVAIATKSDLIVRDIDVLQHIRIYAPVLCKLTITTCNDDLARKIEPHVCPSSQRFGAIGALARAGLFAGVLLMPVLPFVTDTPESILGIVRRAAEQGARFVYPGFGVTLRSNQRDYYYHQLDRLFPGLKERYIRRFGGQYSCGSPAAAELYQLFAAECRRLGLLYQMPQIIKAYREGYRPQQVSFFDENDSG